VSQKRDSSKVLDVLEKMRVIKKTEEESEADFDSPESGGYSLDELEAEFSPKPEPAPAAPVYDAAAETPYGIEADDKSLFWDETPVSGDNTDRYLDIESLYGVFDMKTSGTDTIYLIESYISTLPETLPAELRRSIILKIVAASGFDFDQLLSDGIDRVSQLNDYSAQFASRTESIVERRNVEIDALERQIQQIREAINERKNLHKRQFLTIESEAQRLKEVLDFITK
jgi:hypothetical protein